MEAQKWQKWQEAAPKPPLWAEVEKCMEEGTLDRLRNRASTTKAVCCTKVIGDEAREAEAEAEPQAATPIYDGNESKREKARGSECRSC